MTEEQIIAIPLIANKIKLYSFHQAWTADWMLRKSMLSMHIIRIRTDNHSFHTSTQWFVINKLVSRSFMHRRNPYSTMPAEYHSTLTNTRIWFELTYKSKCINHDPLSIRFTHKHCREENSWYQWEQINFNTNSILGEIQKKNANQFTSLRTETAGKLCVRACTHW